MFDEHDLGDRYGEGRSTHGRFAAHPDMAEAWIRPFLSSALLLLVIVFLPGGLGSLLPRLRTKLPA